MNEMVLSKSKDVLSQALMAEIKKIKEQKVRVYRTKVVWMGGRHTDVRPVYFVTTSKEVHLRLGQLDEHAQWNLAVLIQGSISGGSVLIYEDEEKTGAFFATVTPGESGDTPLIHLELAH